MAPSDSRLKPPTTEGDAVPDVHSHGLVVGVDESEGSVRALAFAMREASLRGTGLHIVTVWGSKQGAAGLAGHGPEQVRQRTQEIQDVAVATALGEIDARPVLMRSVVRGDAGEVLCEIAKDSDYLVVGSVEERSTRTSLLGTVSDYCLRYAACAIVIVPPKASLPVDQKKSGKSPGALVA
jgi:nucleotide-binding universal stress UspA family protein